jgi:hypothetical protein
VGAPPGNGEAALPLSDAQGRRSQYGGRVFNPAMEVWPRAVMSYRRAGRMVGISRTEVGDSLGLRLGPLAALGFCQPDATFSPASTS